MSKDFVGSCKSGCETTVLCVKLLRAAPSRRPGQLDTLRGQAGEQGWLHPMLQVRQLPRNMFHPNAELAPLGERDSLALAVLRYLREAKNPGVSPIPAHPHQSLMSLDLKILVASSYIWMILYRSHKY